MKNTNKPVITSTLKANPALKPSIDKAKASEIASIGDKDLDLSISA